MSKISRDLEVFVEHLRETAITDDDRNFANKVAYAAEKYTEQSKDQAPSVSKERVIAILRDYISNDAEAADPDYVAEALEQAGVTRTEATELGLTDFI